MTPRFPALCCPSYVLTCRVSCACPPPDMESIDSLARAINEFGGGMVLVSHDMRLISQVRLSATSRTRTQTNRPTRAISFCPKLKANLTCLSALALSGGQGDLDLRPPDHQPLHGRHLGLQDAPAEADEARGAAEEDRGQHGSQQRGGGQYRRSQRQLSGHIADISRRG